MKVNIFDVFRYLKKVNIKSVVFKIAVILIIIHEFDKTYLSINNFINII
jgi:hypothetical protein